MGLNTEIKKALRKFAPVAFLQFLPNTSVHKIDPLVKHVVLDAGILLFSRPSFNTSLSLGWHKQLARHFMNKYIENWLCSDNPPHNLVLIQDCADKIPEPKQLFHTHSRYEKQKIQSEIAAGRRFAPNAVLPETHEIYAMQEMWPKYMATSHLRKEITEILVRELSELFIAERNRLVSYTTAVSMYTCHGSYIRLFQPDIFSSQSIPNFPETVHGEADMIICTILNHIQEHNPDTKVLLISTDTDNIPILLMGNNHNVLLKMNNYKDPVTKLDFIEVLDIQSLFKTFSSCSEGGLSYMLSFFLVACLSKCDFCVGLPKIGAVSLLRHLRSWPRPLARYVDTNDNHQAYSSAKIQIDIPEIAKFLAALVTSPMSKTARIPSDYIVSVSNQAAWTLQYWANTYSNGYTDPLGFVRGGPDPAMFEKAWTRKFDQERKIDNVLCHFNHVIHLLTKKEKEKSKSKPKPKTKTTLTLTSTPQKSGRLSGKNKKIRRA